MQIEKYYWCIKTLTKLGVQFEDVPNSPKKKKYQRTFEHFGHKQSHGQTQSCLQNLQM